MATVPVSYLLAIFADRNTGEPFTGADRIGHVVRVGPNPLMPIVQEFSDGGRFEHEDCAPASMESRFREGGFSPSVTEIEQIAGTGLNGTRFPGCIKALEYWDVSGDFSPHNPPPGYIMNPMIPAIVSILEFPKYLAASQGGCIIMGTGVVPAPPPPPVVEDDVLILFTAKTATGSYADCLSVNWMTFRWIHSGPDLVALEASAKAQGATLRYAPGFGTIAGAVANINAYGVPQDETTAKLFGIAFP